MNKQLISILLMLCVPLSTTAVPPQQGDFNIPSDKGTRIERMTDDLGLNEEQKTKVKAILNEENGTIKAYSKEERAQFKDVLTPEQMAEFDAIAQQHLLHKPSGIGE